MSAPLIIYMSLFPSVHFLGFFSLNKPNGKETFA